MPRRFYKHVEGYEVLKVSPVVFSQQRERERIIKSKVLRSKKLVIVLIVESLK